MHDLEIERFGLDLIFGKRQRTSICGADARALFCDEMLQIEIRKVNN